MEPEAKYTLVGASAIALVALLTAAIVWLLASGQRDDVQDYTIYFAKQSLEGLEVRSDVRMKGIRVGAVTGFSFSSSRPGTVEVAIGISPKAPVRQSTRAVVDRNLVTGLATIRLVNGDETSARVERTTTGEANPVIAEGSSQLQQFSDTANQLAARADETMRRITALLSPENTAAIGATLVNLQDLTQKAGVAIDHLDRAVDSVGRTSEQARIAAQQLGGDVHRVALRVDDLGTQATTSLREITASAQQLTADLSHLTGASESLLGNGDLELRMTGQQLRASAASLGTTARKFNDPRAAVFGPADENLGPGEAKR
jgi:phospholipid/cholesterol/gamma-HCH transport system substrate-binding protein